MTSWTLKQVQGDAVGQMPGGGSSTATSWDRAFAHFQKAQAAIDAAVHTPDEDLYDRLGARHDRAMRRLLRTPAPNLPALAAKLELALDERSGEFFGDCADMKAIKSDARRLASPADSDSH
jgi:hypothetical protein